MGPKKCSYINCLNTNETKSIFKFPVNNEPRLQLWIKHSGNAALKSQTLKELKQRFLCEDHFKPGDVYRRYMRSRVLPTAVPIIYICPDPIATDSTSQNVFTNCYMKKSDKCIQQESNNESTSSEQLEEIIKIESEEDMSHNEPQEPNLNTDEMVCEESLEEYQDVEYLKTDDEDGTVEVLNDTTSPLDIEYLDMSNFGSESQATEKYEPEFVSLPTSVQCDSPREIIKDNESQPKKRITLLLKTVDEAELKKAIQNGKLKVYSPLHKKLSMKLKNLKRQYSVKKPSEVTGSVHLKTPVVNNNPLDDDCMESDDVSPVRQFKDCNSQINIINYNMKNVAGNNLPSNKNQSMVEKQRTVNTQPTVTSKGQTILQTALVNKILNFESPIITNDLPSNKNQSMVEKQRTVNTQPTVTSKGQTILQTALVNKILNFESPIITNVPEVSSQICQQNNTVPSEKTKNQYINLIKELHCELQKANGHVRRLQQRNNILKSNVKLSSNPQFLKALDAMPPIARTITMIQFRNMPKKKYRNYKRFTEEEKKLGCSLYRQSKTSYKFLRKLGFIMPDRNTLTKYSLRSDIENAVDRSNTLVKLKDLVKAMKPEHRLCTVVFDEKLLLPHNRKRQEIPSTGIKGEVVVSENDHALVFMVKGILKFYQEPVSFIYSCGPTSGFDLARHIKSVISDLQSIGFKVAATICDHAENNRNAIEKLINEARCDFLLTGAHYNDNVFVVNNQRIIAIYDPPHLLKSVRNHLMTKDLGFELKGQRKTAKWQHLEMMLRENLEYKGHKLVNKLTESHIYPKSDDITKIKLASQVFSQTVSTYMGYLADKQILPPESRETADLLLFFDQLFDSLNGYLANTHKNGKPLLNTVKLNSSHHKKWTESIEILKTMKFRDNNREVAVVDIECWIWTLRSIQLLIKKLLVHNNIKNVWMRHLNQDALERVFRNDINPTPKTLSFRALKKTNNVPLREPLTGEAVTQKMIKSLSKVTKQLDNL